MVYSLRQSPRIAKAKAKAKRAIHIPLSEREQRIVERLGAR